MATDEGYADFLAERRSQILAKVEAACARSGRSARAITIYAVSKTVGVEEVVAAMEAGFDHFAENRPQELVAKLEGLKASGVAAPPFDMIGNLQKNKINAVLGRAQSIQSVASAHLAENISRRAAERGLVVPVLLEVNVSGEPSKSGFAPDELKGAAEGLMDLEALDIQGLMTMGPKGEPVADRETFSGLRELARDLEDQEGMVLPRLSCGMSDDFTIAIEEGATDLRLGRIVFDRDYRVE